MQGSVTVHMAAPPEKVWDLVSDVTRIGEFSPETFDAEWLDGATGPAVGTRFRGHVLRNGTDVLVDVPDHGVRARPGVRVRGPGGRAPGQPLALPLRARRRRHGRHRVLPPRPDRRDEDLLGARRVGPRPH